LPASSTRMMPTLARNPSSSIQSLLMATDKKTLTGDYFTPNIGPD
jgi:hypothetical protein